MYNIPPNTEISRRCRDALKLPWDAFLKELTLICLMPDAFEDFRPKKLPPVPQELATYRAFSEKEKESFREDFPNFFRDGAAGKYLDAVESVHVTNARNRRWLLDMTDCLKDDPENLSKVERRLLEFGHDPQLIEDAKEYMELVGGRVISGTRRT